MKKNKLRTGGQILYIPANRLTSDPMKPRIYFNNDELNDLCASMEDSGILEPLTVRPIKNGNYRIVSGERRYRAAALAGIEDIPCVLIRLSDEEAAFISVIENLRKSSLHFFEIAQAIEQIHSVFGFTYADIADRLGMSMNELTDILKYLSVDHALRKKIVENGLTERHVRELVKLNDKDKEMLVAEIIEKRMNVTATRERCQEVLKNHSGKKQRTVTYFKDITIFVNTIDRAIDTMVKSGIKADSLKTESENSIEYRLLIPK